MMKKEAIIRRYFYLLRFSALTTIVDTKENLQQISLAIQRIRRKCGLTSLTTEIHNFSHFVPIFPHFGLAVLDAKR